MHVVVCQRHRSGHYCCIREKVQHRALQRVRPTSIMSGPRRSWKVLQNWSPRMRPKLMVSASVLLMSADISSADTSLPRSSAWIQALTAVTHVDELLQNAGKHDDVFSKRGHARYCMEDIHSLLFF